MTARERLPDRRLAGAVSRNSDGTATGVIGAVLDLIAGERGQ